MRAGGFPTWTSGTAPLPTQNPPVHGVLVGFYLDPQSTKDDSRYPNKGVRGIMLGSFEVQARAMDLDKTPRQRWFCRGDGRERATHQMSSLGLWAYFLQLLSGKRQAVLEDLTTVDGSVDKDVGSRVRMQGARRCYAM